MPLAHVTVLAAWVAHQARVHRLAARTARASARRRPRGISGDLFAVARAPLWSRSCWALQVGSHGDDWLSTRTLQACHGECQNPARPRPWRL